MKQLLLFLLLAFHSARGADAAKPNILWFVVDDMSAHFSSYGEKLIETPHVDRLAREGVRFTQAHVTAPVCSPCRSAMITGMYQTSIGAHHHRSGRGVEKIRLAAPVEPVPGILQRAGYYTCIGDGLNTPGAKKGQGKTDYNFEWDKSIYDGGDWAGRKEGQPFFMQVQMPGGKLRGGTRASANRLSERAAKDFGAAVKPADVTLPPYYPRDPVLLEDWAAYLDTVRLTDKHVGEVIARLEQEGLLENTLVIFMTDHGISHARGKQFLYDEGTHVPLVIRGPGVPKGVTREDPVEANIDMPAISLAAAGIPVPAWMQGRDVLARDYAKRDAIFAARDRCDETVEGIRSVRTDRWKYIRNFYPDRPLLQPNAYKDGKEILQTLREQLAIGKLPELSEQLLFAPTRAHEELYDLAADPRETVNLAADPQHRETLLKLRARLDEWMERTNDHGRQPEPEKVYNSDMAAAGGGAPGANREDNARAKNIVLMKRWTTEKPMKVRVQ